VESKSFTIEVFSFVEHDACGALSFLLLAQKKQKGTAKRKQPVWRGQPCGTVVHSDLRICFSMLSQDRLLFLNLAKWVIYVCNILQSLNSHSNKFTSNCGGASAGSVPKAFFYCEA